MPLKPLWAGIFFALNLSVASAEVHLPSIFHEHMVLQRGRPIPVWGRAILASPFTNDIGNIGDIHLRNQKDVGERLALWALARTYGQYDLVFSGPLYKSMEILGDKVRIQFRHAKQGLATRDGKPPSHFTIAGLACLPRSV